MKLKAETAIKWNLPNLILIVWVFNWAYIFFQPKKGLESKLTMVESKNDIVPLAFVHGPLDGYEVATILAEDEKTLAVCFIFLPRMKRNNESTVSLTFCLNEFFFARLK